jgi:hypothetical protein
MKARLVLDSGKTCVRCRATGVPLWQCEHGALQCLRCFFGDPCVRCDKAADCCEKGTN